MTYVVVSSSRLFHISSLVLLGDEDSGVVEFKKLFRDFSQFAAGTWLCCWCFLPAICRDIFHAIGNSQPYLSRTYVAKIMLRCRAFVRLATIFRTVAVLLAHITRLRATGQRTGIMPQLDLLVCYKIVGHSKFGYRTFLKMHII